MSEDIARLVGAINDDPDPAHNDYTPAVHALVNLGLPALPAVLPLLDAADRFTRLRAQRVLEGATREWVRARAPARPVTGRADADWRTLWRENGDYDWQADAPARARSVALWRAWLDTQLA